MILNLGFITIMTRREHIKVKRQIDANVEMCMRAIEYNTATLQQIEQDRQERLSGMVGEASALIDKFRDLTEGASAAAIRSLSQK